MELQGEESDRLETLTALYPFPNHDHLSKTYLTAEMQAPAHLCSEWIRESALRPHEICWVCDGNDTKKSHRTLIDLITGGKVDALKMIYCGIRFTKEARLTIKEGETMIIVPLHVECQDARVDDLMVAPGEVIWVKQNVVVKPRFFCLAAVTRYHLT